MKLIPTYIARRARAALSVAARFWLSIVARIPRRTPQRLAYVCLARVLDGLDMLIGRAEPTNRETSASESDLWSDEEIVRRFYTMPLMTADTACCVTRICADTVVKRVAFGNYDPCPLSEVLALSFVRDHTEIPTPYVRRVVEYDGDGYILMEAIEGRDLATCWAEMSPWSQFLAAWTLRRYIRQLRQATQSFAATPGPLGASPQTCLGLMFEPNGRGPFRDYALFSAYFNWLHQLAKKTRNFSNLHLPVDLSPFDDSQPLVFTHHDLSFRNVRVGTDGKLWLIDWGWSGFYPPYFEYLSTVYAAQNDEAPESWRRLIPLITDPWFKHEDWMSKIAGVLQTYQPLDLSFLHPAVKPE